MIRKSDGLQRHMSYEEKMMNKLKIIAVMLVAVMMTACGGGEEQNTETAVTTESEITASESEEQTEEATAETTGKSTEETTEETTVTTEMPFEDNPENAYERLYQSFVDDGVIAIPEDFAGAYGYAGELIVMVTADEPSEKYTEILDRYSCIRYKTAENSFNRLNEISSEAKELLAAEFGVSEAFVDVVSNKAGIAILNGDPKQAQNYLKTIEDKSFTLDQLEISMAEPEDTDQETAD